LRKKALLAGEQLDHGAEENIRGNSPRIHVDFARGRGRMGE
jgi:hypothetical protein